MEKKYAPNKYHVTVTGQSLEKFDFYERLDEISRCAYLDKRSIEGAELIKYKKTYEIRITVSDYNSYRKLISPWPKNAFITGVKITDISFVLHFFVYT